MVWTMASANPFDSAMRHFKQVLLSSVLSICAFAANAQQVPTPSGIWVTYDDHTGAATSEVKVTESEAGLTGVIDKILDPLKAQAKCTTDTPLLKEVSPMTHVACWYPM